MVQEKKQRSQPSQPVRSIPLGTVMTCLTIASACLLTDLIIIAAPLALVVVATAFCTTMLILNVIVIGLILDQHKQGAITLKSAERWKLVFVLGIGTAFLSLVSASLLVQAAPEAWNLIAIAVEAACFVGTVWAWACAKEDTSAATEEAGSPKQEAAAPRSSERDDTEETLLTVAIWLYPLMEIITHLHEVHIKFGNPEDSSNYRGFAGKKQERKWGGK